MLEIEALNAVSKMYLASVVNSVAVHVHVGNKGICSPLVYLLERSFEALYVRKIPWEDLPSHCGW